MGREGVSLTAAASVSRHNAPEDDEDNAAWNAFVRAVREAAGAAEEAGLSIEVFGDEALPEGQWS